MRDGYLDVKLAVSKTAFVRFELATPSYVSEPFEKLMEQVTKLKKLNRDFI